MCIHIYVYTYTHIYIYIYISITVSFTALGGMAVGHGGEKGSDVVGSKGLRSQCVAVWSGHFRWQQLIGMATHKLN